MKNTGNALELFLRISFNPIVSAFGIIVIAGLLTAAALSPESPDSEDYMSMIASVSFGQIGIIAFFIPGCIMMSRNKYFSSLPFARTLFTVVPAVAAGVPMLIYYDAAVVIAALCWERAALSDLLVFLPLNSFIVCLALSAVGKPKLEWAYLICMLLLGAQQVVLPNISATAHGLGLETAAAGIIGGLIFIAGIALTLLITALWWKKCDHIYRGNGGYIRTNFK